MDYKTEALQSDLDSIKDFLCVTDFYRARPSAYVRARNNVELRNALKSLKTKDKLTEQDVEAFAKGITEDDFLMFHRTLVLHSQKNGYFRSMSKRLGWIK